MFWCFLPETLMLYINIQNVPFCRLSVRRKNMSLYLGKTGFAAYVGTRARHRCLIILSFLIFEINLVNRISTSVVNTQAYILTGIPTYKKKTTKSRLTIIIHTRIMRQAHAARAQVKKNYTSDIGTYAVRVYKKSFSSFFLNIFFSRRVPFCPLRVAYPDQDMRT